jgi:hypothetical protein
MEPVLSEQAKWHISIAAPEDKERLTEAYGLSQLLYPIDSDFSKETVETVSRRFEAITEKLLSKENKSDQEKVFFALVLIAQENLKQSASSEDASMALSKVCFIAATGCAYVFALAISSELLDFFNLVRPEQGFSDCSQHFKLRCNSQKHMGETEYQSLRKSMLG